MACGACADRVAWRSFDMRPTNDFTLKGQCCCKWLENHSVEIFPLCDGCCLHFLLPSWFDVCWSVLLHLDLLDCSTKSNGESSLRYADRARLEPNYLRLDSGEIHSARIMVLAFLID